MLGLYQYRTKVYSMVLHNSGALNVLLCGATSVLAKLLWITYSIETQPCVHPVVDNPPSPPDVITETSDISVIIYYVLCMTIVLFTCIIGAVTIPCDNVGSSHSEGCR